MTQGLDVPEGKPLDERLVEPIPASPALTTLMSRPVPNLVVLELDPPGPATVQHHVDVPIRPAEGGSR